MPTEPAQKKGLSKHVYSTAVPLLLPVVESQNIPSHVCLSSCIRGMPFDGRHPGLLQIEGGNGTTARRRRALQRHELRRKFHVGPGRTGPEHRRIIIAVLLLVSVHLLDVRAVLGPAALPLPEPSFEDCLAAIQSWQMRCIGLSQAGSASPHNP